MKRIFGILAFFVIVAMTNAQTVSPDKMVWASSNYASYTGVATDTLNGVATIDVVFRIELAKMSRYTFSYMIDGDTMAGSSGDVTIQPYGSYDGVTYTSLGSSVSWTASTANYLANTSQNTYSVAIAGTETTASHTRTTAAFNITADTVVHAATGNTAGFADTTVVPAQVQTVAVQTNTVAVTNTVTLPGTDYGYIKILLTGASGARAELQLAAIKVTPVGVP